MAAPRDDTQIAQVGQDCARQFLNSLSPDEQALFQAANVSKALLQEVEDANIKHKETSTSRKASAAVLPFIAGIEQYGRALDVFANSNELLCPIWGSIRIVLHLAKEFGEYFERITAMLEDIGGILERMPRCLSLYPNNKNLQTSVVAIHRDLYEFASRAKHVFRVGKTRSHGLQSVKNVVGFAAALRLVWKPFDVQFGDIKDRISKNVVSIEIETDIAEKEIANQERNKDDVRWSEVRTSQRLLAEFIDEQSIAKVNEWLSPVNVATNHKAATNLRHGDTGTWFLQCRAFQDWLKDDNSFLWLHAIPGAGKTVLASSIINHLRQEVQSKTTAVAYFYCDYKDVHKQDPSKVLGTILASLAKQNDHVFNAVQEFFSEQYKDTPTYSAEFDELLNHFADFVNGHFQSGIVVVDALDEAGPANMECLAHAFKGLHQLCRQFKFLITSRNELCISRAFEDLPSFSIEQSDVAADVKDFITADLSAKIAQKKLKVRDPDLEILIRDSLVDGSKGMFQWAKCQIEALCRARNNKAIKAALLNLPKTLQDTYIRILQRVEDEFPEDVKTVCKILRWLVKGIRNLTLDELAEAIAVDPEGDETAMDFDAVDNDPEDVLELLGGLVTVTSDRTISLAHYSVKEFLVSDDIKVTKPCFWISDGEAEAQLASVCLTYLCYEDFGCAQLPDVPKLEQRLQKYKLFRYATQAWAIHAQHSENETFDGHEHVTDLTMRFLSSGNAENGNFSSWVECHQYCKFGKQNLRRLVEPLFVAAFFGLREAVTTLLANTTDVTRESVVESLLAAATNGHTGVVKTFLDYFETVPAGNEDSHDPAVEDRQETETTEDGSIVEDEREQISSESGFRNELPKALYAAAAKGHDQVVSILLSQGTPINARGGRDGTALQAAALEGRPDVVKILLEQGASHWEACKRYGTPLAAAAEKAHQRTFQVLLEHGANPNGRGGWHSLPLVSAIMGKNINIIRQLIEAGADVTAVGGRHGGPLPVAAAFGMNDLIMELVEHGARVNDNDDKASDALYAASLAGHVTTVELLLDLGADVNAKGGRHRNALGVASSEGHLEVAVLLIDSGADLEFFDEHWGNALQAAAQRGHVALVRMLAEAGIDVNADGGDKGTALVGASANGHIDVIDALFELDVIAGNTEEMTSALVAASFGGHGDTVQLLFDKGADVSRLNEYSQTANHCTPLQAAASKGHLEVVELLIELGATVNDKAEAWFGTSLIAATTANNHRKELIAAILAAGADVNDISGLECHFHGSPLVQTIRQKDLECTTILLDHGANVNLQWPTFLSPLEVAISEADQGMVDFLLERGAAINNVSEPMDLRDKIDDGLESGTITALQTAAWYGDEGLVRQLVALGAELSVISDAAPFKSALQCAAYRGHAKIVEALIELGSETNERGGYFGSPLQAAVCTDNLEVVRILLDAGAIANEVDVGYYRSALLSACMKDMNNNAAIIDLLIRGGADVNQKQKGAFPYPLHAVGIYIPISETSPEDATDALALLIKAGADVDAQGGLFGTAMQAAASRGDDVICSRLIAAGANPNITGGFYHTPLQAAYRHGYYVVINVLYWGGARNNLTGGSIAGSVFGQGLGSLPGMMDDGGIGGCCLTLISQLLFTHSIDPNLPYGKYGNPLQNAVVSERGLDEVHRILLAGGDIDKVAGFYGTAVNAAIRIGNDEVRDELLERGANVHLGNDWYPNAAFGAVRANDSKTVKLLLTEKNVDVKLISTRFGTLAQCAAQIASIGILRQVLRAGADMNTPACGTYGSPLQAAALSGDEDKIRYLVHRGADVKATGGRFGGVLNTAIFNCSDEIIELLLKKGADVNERGRVYCTPLQAAACNPWLSTILILLRYGADVNRHGGRYGTALQAACAAGRISIAKLLVERGADPNIVGGRYRTALNAAAIRGDEEMVRYLLEVAGATWSLVDRRCLGHVRPSLLDEADELLQRALGPSEEEDEEDQSEGNLHEKQEEAVGDEDDEDAEDADQQAQLTWNVESIPNACDPYQPRRSKWTFVREMSFHILAQKYVQGSMTNAENSSLDEGYETLTTSDTSPKKRRGRASRTATLKAGEETVTEVWDNSVLDWVGDELDS